MFASIITRHSFASNEKAPLKPPVRRFAGAGTDFWSGNVYACATDQITLRLRSAAQHHSVSQGSSICHSIFVISCREASMGPDPARSVNKK